MDVRFITPLGALFALTALVPLAVYVMRGRRLRELRSALGLEQPTLRSQIPFLAALLAVPVLLGAAAAQPVVETTRTVQERTDAQVLVAVDVSRSMLASAGPDAPTRFERAQRVARRLRAELPTVPFGIASLTDRVLPHVFPTTDRRVFDATLIDSLDIEQPPPGAFYLTYATTLDALAAVPTLDYFPPAAKKRVLVVLTDGESRPFDGRLAFAFRRTPRIATVFVRIWNAEERIYETGVSEGGYRPDPRAGSSLARAADLVAGRVLGEEDADGIAGAVAVALGEGETVARSRDSGRLALMPYLTLAVVLPLAYVLLRRNAWLVRRPRPRGDAEAAAQERAGADRRRLESSLEGV